ncbi:MAG: MFS transporter, partial [Nitrososphaerales archaeon]
MPTWSYEALKRVISLITVASTHMINHAYLQIHLALLPVFMIEFNLELSTIGMIVSIATLCQVLATIPGGIIADKLGSVKVILLSFLLTLIGALMMSQTFNLYMLIFGISIITLSTAIYHPQAYSLVSRLVAPNSRGKALGIHGGAGDIGLALGPITAGILLSSYGWRFVYLVWLIPMLLSTLILLRVKPSTYSVEKEFTVINKKSTFITITSDFLTLALITYLLIIALRAVGMQTVSTILSAFLVFGRKIPKDTASILFGLMPLMGGITAPIGGYFTDKIGAKELFAFSL